MNKILSIAVVLSVLPLQIATVAVDAPQKPAIKILFIGNSLTYTHDIPAMIAALAKAGGQGAVEYEKEVPGGCTLEKHWKDGKALAKIKARDWDYVVLQDNSTQPLKAPESMASYGKLFAEAITAKKSQPVWYMTWAWIDKLETQPEITRIYRELAKTNGGLLVPAGAAFGEYRKAHPEQKLVSDNRHPDLAGAYLVACVFYATLYHTSPVGLPGSPAKLDEARARTLQEAAWAAVNN